ncbi:MAG: TIGR04076 family protein [Lachnospiraceae bacterium]|nr:TIGR04076 family protein [Lachnospiraceae bacterium]
MDGKFCGEAWDAISRYVYTALQGGSIMKNWTNDDRMQQKSFDKLREYFQPDHRMRCFKPIFFMMYWK